MDVSSNLMSSHSNYSVHKEHSVVCIQNFAHVDVVSILVIYNLLSPHNYRLLKKTCTELYPCGCGQYSVIYCPHIHVITGYSKRHVQNFAHVGVVSI